MTKQITVRTTVNGGGRLLNHGASVRTAVQGGGRFMNGAPATR